MELQQQVKCDFFEVSAFLRTCSRLTNGLWFTLREITHVVNRRVKYLLKPVDETQLLQEFTNAPINPLNLIMRVLPPIYHSCQCVHLLFNVLHFKMTCELYTMLLITLEWHCTCWSDCILFCTVNSFLNRVSRSLCSSGQVKEEEICLLPQIPNS